MNPEKIPEHLKAHRELEYLRTAAHSANLRKKGKKKSKGQKEAERKARKKVKERYEKLREVNWND
jgi:hypothetical protein